MNFVFVSQEKLAKIPEVTDPKNIIVCGLCFGKFRITKLCVEKCPKCSGYPDRKEKVKIIRTRIYAPRAYKNRK